jgi:hypothetical protein
MDPANVAADPGRLDNGGQGRLAAVMPSADRGMLLIR